MLKNQKDPNISQTGNLLNINFSSSLTYGQKSDLCFWRVVRRFRRHFGVKKADGRTSIPSPFVSLTEIFGKDRDGFTVAIQKSPGLTENPLFTGRWGIKQSAVHNRTIQFFDDQNKRQVIFVSHRINELFNIDEFFGVWHLHNPRRRKQASLSSFVCKIL